MTTKTEKKGTRKRVESARKRAMRDLAVRARSADGAKGGLDYYSSPKSFQIISAGSDRK